MPLGKKRRDLEARAIGVLGLLPIEPVTKPVADAYGSLKASLESKGINPEDNDLWMAATALTLGYVVVTRDQIFSRVPGLQVEDWSV